MLNHLVALRRGSLTPPLTQVLALLRWQLLKAPVVLPHGRLLTRRQTLKSLPAVAQLFPFIGRQRMPLLVALLRLTALLGGHCEPAAAASRERLLTLGRQSVPVEPTEQPLLIWSQARPWHGLCWPRRRC